MLEPIAFGLGLFLCDGIGACLDVVGVGFTCGSIGNVIFGDDGERRKRVDVRILPAVSKPKGVRASEAGYSAWKCAGIDAAWQD